jgi:hypothetical protein
MAEDHLVSNCESGQFATLRLHATPVKGNHLLRRPQTRMRLIPLKESAMLHGIFDVATVQQPIHLLFDTLTASPFRPLSEVQTLCLDASGSSKQFSGLCNHGRFLVSAPAKDNLSDHRRLTGHAR